MGLGMNRFWFSVVDFAGLSVMGLRVTVLNPDGTQATLYADERRKGIVPNPVVLPANGVAAFWSSWDRVDVVIQDSIRGRCLLRNITPLVHRLTFEPDSALCKLLATYSDQPWIHCVNVPGGGFIDMHPRVPVDFRQMLAGDVIHIHAVIETDCIAMVEGYNSATYELAIGNLRLSQNSINCQNYDTGKHLLDIDTNIMVAATGVDGLFQFSCKMTNQIIVAQGTLENPIYWYQRYDTVVGFGTEYGEALNMAGEVPIFYQVATSNGDLPKWDVRMRMMIMELQRKP
jgi:hypothetical protein